MKFKPVPAPPPTLETVHDARRGVPLVPAGEKECLARLRRRLDLPSRAAARTWLTFLRALELVSRTGAGYVRVRTDPTPDRLRAAFCDGVFLAADVAAALDADPWTPADVFESVVASRVPTWERHRDAAWRDRWTERTARVLRWLSRLGVATPVDGGYVRADARASDAE